MVPPKSSILIGFFFPWFSPSHFRGKHIFSLRSNRAGSAWSMKDVWEVMMEMVFGTTSSLEVPGRNREMFSQVFGVDLWGNPLVTVVPGLKKNIAGWKIPRHFDGIYQNFYGDLLIYLWLFCCFFRGWNTTQLYSWNYFMSHRYILESQSKPFFTKSGWQKNATKCQDDTVSCWPKTLLRIAGEMVKTELEVMWIFKLPMNTLEVKETTIKNNRNPTPILDD